MTTALIFRTIILIKCVCKRDKDTFYKVPETADFVENKKTKYTAAVRFKEFMTLRDSPY